MNRFARHALILSALFAASATAQAAELTVVLHDVRAQTGLIKVALVDSQAGWDGQAAPVQATGAPPSGGQATFVFKDLKPGAYAVLITHDENGNGQLDTNAMGMPLEGYGFSNNPRVMRKPTWDEARFDLAGAAANIDVSLR
ncbi:MAG: DUF2141 domain-containing protein [Pseudoxanthomonas sp.]